MGLPELQMNKKNIKLFGKWSFDDIEISDIALEKYIAVKPQSAQFVPHSSERFQTKRFLKAKCPIVERLTNSIMLNGRNSGKKLLANSIVNYAFEIVNLLTDRNPIQILVEALVNSGPREDKASGRIGIVDVSPLRRVNQAIWLITTGAREASFRNIKTVAECLAD